jgi:hypothetical protein
MLDKTIALEFEIDAHSILSTEAEDEPMQFWSAEAS